MGRLLDSAKGIEHLGPVAPEPEGEKEAKTQAEDGTNGGMHANFIRCVIKRISVRILQIMLEMILCELADVLAHALAEDG